MAEMISVYLEQTPPLIKAMKDSLQQQDWEQLKSAVHKMIPSFSIMGISTDYENIARKINDYANTQLQATEITDWVTQLENVLAQSCKELEEELNNMKNTKA